MNVVLKMACAVVAALTVAACGSTRTPAGTRASLADIGPRPTKHTALFLAYLDATLKDPGSAQVKHFAGPMGWVKEGTWGSSSAAYGWGACYSVNAKNSFGGYTGARWYVAVVRNEQLVSVVGPSGSSTIQEDAVISAFCRTAGPPMK